jgi:hypothetical protein
LLIRPIDIKASALSDSDAGHILTISTYLPYLMGQQVVSVCTARGMLIRCARYMTEILKRRGSHEQGQPRLIMSDAFDTTLPCTKGSNDHTLFYSIKRTSLWIDVFFFRTSS